MRRFMWPRSNHRTLFIGVLLLAALLMTCWAFVCACVSVSHHAGVFCKRRGTAESPASGSEIAHTHVQPHKHVHTQTFKRKKKKWLQQKTRQGPKSPPSQAACPLVIARGIGSPLKRLRACVHVFKRQCYVSACHLWALALRFSPTLAPFLSLSFCLSGVEKYRRGAQWPRPGRLLCLAVGV